MSNDKRKKIKTMNNRQLNSKTQLLQALEHLRGDVTWMGDLIGTLQQIDFPDSDFELSGLIRKICYELILENPDLFRDDNPKTRPLKTILYNALAKIKVKRSQELLSKMVERVANELKQQSIQKNAGRRG